MKNKEIFSLSINELQVKLKEEKLTIVKLKLNHSISSLENPIKIRDNRKFIARLNTELTKKLLNKN